MLSTNLRALLHIVLTILGRRVCYGRAQQVYGPTCYAPDGVTTTSDVPCRSNPDTPSPCCGVTAFCVDNGLCYGYGALSRGSCTDPDWGEGCPKYCVDSNSTRLAT